MAKKVHTALGLDLGEETLKLVAYHTQSKQIDLVALTFADAQAALQPVTLGKMIRDWLVSLNLDKTPSKVAVCLPGQHAALRVIETDPEDSLEEAARFELQTWLGTSEANHVIHTLPQGSGSNGTQAHLLAAVPQARISWLQSVFQSAGLNLAMVGLDIVAISNAFEANYPAWVPQLVALVKAEGRYLQILWVQAGKVRGHAVLSVPADASTSDRLALDGAKAIQAGEGLWFGRSEDCAAVFLCGDRAVDPGFAQKMGSGVRCDVQVLDAFATVPFPTAAGMKAQLSETSPKCAAALGLALALSEGDAA